MSYCLISDLSRILQEKVKIGSNNIGTPQTNQGSTRANISPADAVYYINYATQYLDGRLKPFYVTPLRRIKSYETPLVNDIHHGSNVTVTVEDAGAFITGGMVRLQDKESMQTAMIVTPPQINQTPYITTLVLDRVNSDFLVANNARISILAYPDPIPLIVAQLASSFILDRIFVSMQSPDVSAFGKTQRNLARAQIENILSGEVFLMGQEVTGRRFFKGTLMDAYKSPAEIQKAVDKE